MYNDTKEELTKQWEDAIERKADKVCLSCDIPKPEYTFYAKDNTCKLCRKLFALGLRYSYTIKIIPEIILNAVDGKVKCITCKREKLVTRFAAHSYECITCWELRCQTEIAKYKNIYKPFNCRGCLSLKNMDTYPLGRLTCRSCLSRKKKR